MSQALGHYDVSTKNAGGQPSLQGPEAKHRLRDEQMPVPIGIPHYGTGICSSLTMKVIGDTLQYRTSGMVMCEEHRFCKFGGSSRTEPDVRYDWIPREYKIL